MLRLKRNNDYLFFPAAIIMIVICFIVARSLIGFSFFIGIFASSFTLEKDCRKNDSGSYNAGILNLVLNLAVYFIAIILSISFFEFYGLILCAIGIESFRKTFFIKVAKQIMKEGE